MYLNTVSVAIFWELFGQNLLSNRRPLIHMLTIAIHGAETMYKHSFSNILKNAGYIHILFYFVLYKHF